METDWICILKGNRFNDILQNISMLFFLYLSYKCNPMKKERAIYKMTKWKGNARQGGVNLRGDGSVNEES